MKKRKIVIPLLFAFTVILISFKNSRQPNDPWRNDQLIEPAALAAILNDPSAKQPVIYNIGIVRGIKNAIIEGAAKDSANLLKWKNELQTLPRDTDIVIYCGCCPFEYCPNIRPAFQLLNEMGFTHQKLLNLPHNLKADWVSKGYPMPAE